MTESNLIISGHIAHDRNGGDNISTFVDVAEQCPCHSNVNLQLLRASTRRVCEQLMKQRIGLKKCPMVTMRAADMASKELLRFIPYLLLVSFDVLFLTQFATASTNECRVAMEQKCAICPSETALEFI